MLFAIDANLFASFDFPSNVDLRSWIVPDQDNGQAGTDSGGSHLFDLRRHLTADVAGHSGAVKNSSRHIRFR